MTGFLMGWGLFYFKKHFLVLFFLKTEASALVKVFQRQLRVGEVAQQAGLLKQFSLSIFFLLAMFLFIRKVGWRRKVQPVHTL